MLRPCLLLCVSVLLAFALPPRVIFVATLDDFGYASASFNQASPTWETTTPRMDELARSGVILRRAYCHSFCSPTRSAFLSGRLPVHVQVNNVQPDMPNAGVPSSMTTLPQKLSAAGWSCHGRRKSVFVLCKSAVQVIPLMPCSCRQVGHWGCDICTHAGGARLQLVARLLFSRDRLFHASRL